MTYAFRRSASRRRILGPLAVVSAALALSVSSAASAVDATQTPAGTDAVVSSPSVPRVLQSPSDFGPAELDRLVQELAVAGEAPVILRVPGDASLKDVTNDDLARLASAAQAAELVVVQQGDADIDGAAPVLAAFADERFLRPGADPASGEGGKIWETVRQLTGCGSDCAPREDTAAGPQKLQLAANTAVLHADLAGSGRTLAAALEAPAPEDGGNGMLILFGLLVLAAVGLTALFVSRGRRAPPDPVMARQPSKRKPKTPPDVKVIEAQVPPGTRKVPAPQGNGLPAEVISVLDPEGYVEIGNCLQRVRWASADAPAVPGEWVDVEQRGGRLWAFPASRPSRPTPSRSV